MAYAIISTPPAFASAHAECLITVFDSTKPQDDATYPNYKYVAEVLINGSLVATLKAYPQPDTLAGVFDIGPIIRSYLSSNFAPSASFAGNQYRPWVAAQIQFGEEYDGTTYYDIITDAERKYFDTYKAGPWLSNDILNSRLNSFATNRGDTITIAEDCESHLLPFFATASGTSTYSLTAKKDGTTTGTDTDTISITYPSGMVHYNLAKAAVSGLVGTANFDSLTITVSGQTKTVRYACPPRGNTTRTIAFLNQYGGYETYDFRLVSRQTIQMEREQFQQSAYRLGASGQVSYGTSNVYNRGRSAYSSYQRQTWQLNTDWLTDADYVWLKELLASTETWLLLGDMWVPCTINTDSYEVRTYAASKLTQLSIDIQVDGDYNSQYR